MDRPRDISGFRSRAINAAYAWTDANRPIGGPGVNVSDAAGGRVVSLSPEGRIPRPRPWDAVAVPDGDGSFDVYIYTAPVVGPDGAAIPFSPFSSGYSALAPAGAQVAGNGPGGAPRLSIAAADVADGWLLAEANEDLTGWRLALDPNRHGASHAVPVADITVADGVLVAARGIHSGAAFVGATGHPWRVTATPNGSGGATVSMIPGVLLVAKGGRIRPAHAHLGAATATAGKTVVATVDTTVSSPSVSVSLESSIPQTAVGVWAVPVAAVRVSSGVWSVEQYLFGSVLVFHAVPEEV